jgi:flagellar protein FliL
MAEQEETLEAIKTDGAGAAPKKSSFSIKLVIFGIPIFIVQLAAVYFVTANILLKKFENHNNSAASVKTDTVQAATELGKNIYPLDDIIVNPADTDGKRLLLASIGIDLGKAEMQNEVKAREVMVKDIIISTLASKNIGQLNDIAYRDTIKTEITTKMKKSIPSITINSIYFSKFIIQ